MRGCEAVNGADVEFPRQGIGRSLIRAAREAVSQAGIVWWLEP